MSDLISSIHRSWSSVSSYSNFCSNSRCHSLSSEKAKPLVCSRLAYRAISSLAMSETAFFIPLAGLAPLAGIEAVEADGGILLAADVFGHQVQLGDGDKKHIGTAIADLDIVLDHSLDLFFDDSLKLADTMGGMDHIIPHRQISDILDGLADPPGPGLFRLVGR